MPLVPITAAAKVAGPPLDGLSFAPALTSTPVAPSDWREYQFSEYFGDGPGGEVCALDELALYECFFFFLI
jgi:hypothetical protein